MKKIALFLFILGLSMSIWPAQAQFSIDLETGAIFSGYNDVRIPGDTGTLFSFSQDLKSDPSAFARVRLLYDFNPRHHIAVLVAPLTIKASGEVDRDLLFAGGTFPANTPLEGTYRFNSYRVTYRYDFYRKEKLEIGVGFTAKIRDAEIRLEGAGMSASKTNVGFVPIIHFRMLWHIQDALGFLLEGDALAAPQGRAEDVQAALRYKVSDHLTLRAGYRVLEGGADNDEVYTFSLFHYAALGATWSF